MYNYGGLIGRYTNKRRVIEISDEEDFEDLEDQLK